MAYYPRFDRDLQVRHERQCWRWELDKDVNDCPGRCHLHRPVQRCREVGTGVVDGRNLPHSGYDRGVRWRTRCAEPSDLHLPARSLRLRTLDTERGSMPWVRRADGRRLLEFILLLAMDRSGGALVPEPSGLLRFGRLLMECFAAYGCRKR